MDLEWCKNVLEGHGSSQREGIEDWEIDALYEHVTAELATARAEGRAEGLREGRLAGLREAGELCENAVVQTIRERRDWPHLPPFGSGGVNMTNGMDSVDYIHMGRTDDPELEAEFWARGETIRERDEAAEREVTGGGK